MRIIGDVSRETFMKDYFIIIEILKEVIAGNNLKELFNKHVINSLNPSKIKDISYGSIRHYIFLQSILNFIISKPIKNKTIEIILIISLYEINFSKKPIYAIVNDAVNLTFKISKIKALKNFVNAILRNYISKYNNINLKFKKDYDLLEVWVKKIKEQYPKEFNSIINTSILKPKLALRLNPLKITIE